MPCSSLLESLKTSFIDRRVDSDENCRVQLLVNEQSQGSCVLNALEDELRHCSEFSMSVAFVTLSGITPLLLTLSELAERGIKGRILTTDYLTFSEPAALRRLAQFPSFEVRMFCTADMHSSAGGFHTKGYLFKTGTQLRFIVGSSNLTGAALKSSQEWNVRFTANEEGELSRNISEEFEALWASPLARPLSEVIDSYEESFAEQARIRSELARSAAREQAQQKGLKPNLMQQRLIANLSAFMRQPLDDKSRSDRRALLISATGTGKTFASAFAVQSLAPRRILFLVHREQIARKSAQSYRQVLGNSYQYGFLISSDRSGTALSGERQAVFATMQTMVRNLELGTFPREYFDIIVIDEVHRAGAQSYRRIMDYFNPRLWLGMTATPDRPDSENIYELFDHQILLDIRLQQALEQELLCPFHYFGISELITDALGQGELGDFSKLTSSERVEHILKNIKRFGFCGRRVKGLMFCSSVQEARTLSDRFNQAGLRTLALSGEDSQQSREQAIARLTSDSPECAPLDYLLTVDIFNEGVDIPEINQVVLLRQTQSPIVFVQQLGRGLRKAPGKEFLVVIDFIGNYANNYMIPLALSGDRSCQKDIMRKTLIANTIPGNSTIHFDSIARERIFRAIDAARTNSFAQLKSAYQLLKYQLGRVPSLLDFEEHGSIDAVKFFSQSGSYVEFLCKVEKDSSDRPEVSKIGREMLAYLSNKIGSGQRPSEALVLQAVLEGRTSGLKEHLTDALIALGLDASQDHLLNCSKVLTNNFARNKDEQMKTPHAVFIDIDAAGQWQASAGLLAELDAGGDFRRHLSELVAFVIDRFKKRFSSLYRRTALKLYERYTYDDVCRLLNWPANMPANNIGGYRYDAPTKTLPVFINYDKAEDAINYHDHFESPQSLIALSKTNRAVTSPDADHIYKRKPADKDNRIFLFVRKNKDDNETKAFYFLGEVTAQGEPDGIYLNGRTPAFEIRYRLSDPVRPDIYTYLTH